jgi:hypothetical protein
LSSAARTAFATSPLRRFFAALRGAGSAGFLMVFLEAPETVFFSAALFSLFIAGDLP